MFIIFKFIIFSIHNQYILDRKYIIAILLINSYKFKQTHPMINKESQYTGDHFQKGIVSKYSEQQIDPKRIRRMQMLNQNYTIKEQKNQEVPKAPVKFHLFRQDARKLHRQLTQQNHDLIKMTASMTKSVLDHNRFQLVDGVRNNKNKITNNPDLLNRESSQKPNIVLDFNIQINSSLAQNKIRTKQFFMINPYKKLSIQLQPDAFLNPQYQFFYFCSDSHKSQQLQNNLIQIVDEGIGLISDIKQQIALLTYYLTYFDYIQICKFLFTKKQNNWDSKYPPEVVELARNSLIVDASDEEEDYNKGQLVVDAINLCHRVFQCNQSQLSKPFDSIYYQDLKDFQNYKKLRQIQYKNLRIQAQDIVINTDVRNIISSQKIYLINIIQQMHLSVQLLQANKQKYLVKTLHQMMINKIFQYLSLICGYTTSTILIRYNITDPYSKIYQFLHKSIFYGKPYENLDKKVIEKYPVLEIWYNLPDKIFGFSREEVHSTLYKLIHANIEFEKNMKSEELYQKLKQKKYDRKYLPGATSDKPTNQTNKVNTSNLSNTTNATNTNKNKITNTQNSKTLF